VDNWNERLFVLINASDHPVALWVAAANLVASDMVFLVVMLFGALWVWGRPRRRPALVASAVATALALVPNQVFGLLWYEPRPFVVGAQHAAENAFPSGHATFMFTAG
jgi:undecaprenyl-diphosphatase